jgi:hypothetical protein
MWGVAGSYQQFLGVCFVYLHDRGKGNLSLKMEAAGLSEMLVRVWAACGVCGG